MIYLGILLIFCSRKIKSRASIVYWEGILRIALLFLLTGYGFFGGIGIALALVGIVDLVIGSIYIFGLPRTLNVKAGNLLRDTI